MSSNTTTSWSASVLRARFDHLRRAMLGDVVFAGLLALGLVMGLGLAGLDPTLILAMLVGGLGGVAGLILGLRRLEWFVLLLLTVRPMLDMLKLDALGPLTPATLFGLVFLLVGSWWLFGRHRSGRLTAPSPLTWGMVGLLAAAGLSALVSVVPVISIVAVTRLASAVMMFVVLEQLLRAGTIRIQALMLAVAISAVLVSIEAFRQVFTGTAPVDPFTGLERVTGPFVHASVLAKYAAILLVASCAWLIWTRGKSQLIALAILPLVATMTLVTYTRAAWIAALVGVIVVLARWDWRALLIGLVSATFTALTVPAIYERLSEIWAEPKVDLPWVPDNSLEWRVGYWADLVPMARFSPINGLGFDTIPTIGGIDLAAHNVWLQAYVEMGVVGVLAMVTVVATATITIRRSVAVDRLAPVGAHRAAQEAAVAVAWVLLVLTPTENLINETTTLWYGAAILLCGTAPGGARRQRARHARASDTPDAATLRTARVRVE